MVCNAIDAEAWGDAVEDDMSRSDAVEDVLAYLEGAPVRVLEA